MYTQEDSKAKVPKKVEIKEAQNRTFESTEQQVRKRIKVEVNLNNFSNTEDDSGFLVGKKVKKQTAP
jgi:hypothetical protein